MNRKDVGWAVAVLVASTALVAIATGPALQSSTGDEQWISEHVLRTVDEEAGVVCYVGTLRKGAGISCLAERETALGSGAAPAADVRIDRPNGTYELGNCTTLRGSAPSDAGSVAVYVRGDGDWRLLDVNEDGRLSADDTVAVSPNGTWLRSGVVLSNASDLLGQPGAYRLGVVVSAEAVAPNGSLRARLPADALNDSATSASVPLTVVRPLDTESLVFVDVNGQVAVEDGEVTVRGLAPGAQEVLVVAVDRRGEFTSETLPVARDDTFDEDVALVAPDGAQLSEGPVVGVVLSAGRDGRVGNGVVGEEFGADLGALEGYLRDRRDAVSLSQAQVLDILAAESVDEAGSDDLSVVDTFTFTDARTTVEAVHPAGAPDATGVVAVPVGEPMVVRGLTNRKPGDNSVLVDLVSAETGELASLGETDEWGQTGVWRVEIPTDGLAPGSYLVEASDGDDSDLVRVELVPATGNRSTG